MPVHVAFTPDEAAPAAVGIVVDVLRATSTIAQALASGYQRVLCCAELDEARALRSQIPNSLAGGERNAVRIEDFDVGASPREFLEPRAAKAVAVAVHADPQRGRAVPLLRAAAAAGHRGVRQSSARAAADRPACDGGGRAARGGLPRPHARGGTRVCA